MKNLPCIVKLKKRLLMIQIREDYKKMQPINDSEMQLSRKVVDKEVRGVLEQSENMTPEHLFLIDAIITLPETTPEKELQRRKTAINTVTAYCSVEERMSYVDGQPSSHAIIEA